jgi:tetratricopeptide (TPR) repeat protein
MYENFYNVIGRSFNPVIMQAPRATGDQRLIDRYLAEALVLRAWFHYLTVNIFAKAYDPATAATERGISYAHETVLITEPFPVYTVAEIYKFMLEDIERALSLNAMLPNGVNAQRVGASFAHAVHARVLMSMRKYPEALAAANKSLAINDFIYDHNEMLVSFAVAGVDPSPLGFARPRDWANHPKREDLLSLFRTAASTWFSPEMLAVFDENSVMLNYMPTQVNIPFPTDMGAGTFGMPGEKAVWTSTGTVTEFSNAGLTTVDMHLIKAEALMQTGDLPGAKAVLEHIRKHRIITDRYEPHPAATQQEIFELLKNMARSENWLTYKDFIDLKRWNTYTDFRRANLYRTMLGETRTLRPDSPLWIFPFPETATNFNPNLKHNF